MLSAFSEATEKMVVRTLKLGSTLDEDKGYDVDGRSKLGKGYV